MAPSAIPFIVDAAGMEPAHDEGGAARLESAMARAEQHLGLRAAWAEDPRIDDDERARRLMELAEVAEQSDDAWVAGRAALEAARLREQAGDLDGAHAAAVAALEADPSLAEAGMRVSRLEARRGRFDVALTVGRAALERVGAGSLLEAAADLEAADAFAVALADVARRAEGADAARALLRRALRANERADALLALVELERVSGALDDADAALARLQRLTTDDHDVATAIELAAARLARARKKPELAIEHLEKARALAPRQAGVALDIESFCD